MLRSITFHFKNLYLCIVKGVEYARIQSLQLPALHSSSHSQHLSIRLTSLTALGRLAFAAPISAPRTSEDWNFHPWLIF